MMFYDYINQSSCFSSCNMFLFMTFYQLIFMFLCFFYNFLSINLYINLSILFSVSFYNFLLINLHVSFHVFIYLSIYDFLSMLFHHVFEQMHWRNLYHLLCASSFYFLTDALRKSLSFTMCFLILFLDFLWKHAWAQPSLTGETPTIYYVLPHSISRRTYWGNFYHLLCTSSFYSLTSSIFFENTITGSTRSYWGNPYHLLCASPSCSQTNALSLRKPLLFTMCFLILFFGERLENTSIIYYVLSHSILRRASWEQFYYLLCASPSCSSASALPLGKSLLFSECFLSYRCSRLDIDSDHDRCQVISRNIEETSII